MSEPLFYYTVNELLLNGNCEELALSTQFRAPKESLLACKKYAEQFYESRKKRVDYWTMLGIYEINDYQKFELDITLVETNNGTSKEYVIKSINKNISKSSLIHEGSILSKYPSNVDSGYDFSMHQEESQSIDNLLKNTLEKEYLFKVKQNKRIILWIKRLLKI